MSYGDLVMVKEMVMTMVILASVTAEGAEFFHQSSSLGQRCFGENHKEGICVEQNDCQSKDYVFHVPSLGLFIYHNERHIYQYKRSPCSSSEKQRNVCCVNSTRSNDVTETVTHSQTATLTHFVNETATHLETVKHTVTTTVSVTHTILLTSILTTPIVTPGESTHVKIHASTTVPHTATATASHNVPQTENPGTTTMAKSQGNGFPPERCGGFQHGIDIIVGGKNAPLGSWPWIALLQGTVGGRKKYFCGGNLISDRYVLTAAHCIRTDIKLNIVRLGEHNLAQNPDSEDGIHAPTPQDIPIHIDDVILHPDYNHPCNQCNDIALIRLSRKVNFTNRFVMPICLPLNPEKDMGFSVQNFTGQYASAAGWGLTDPDPHNFKTPDVLQEAKILIQPNEYEYCQRLKKDYNDPSMVICGGGDGRDTCRGDSGGPLTLTDIKNTKQFLIGITSKGPVRCGALNSVGLYTSVSYYVPWILDNLRP